MHLLWAAKRWCGDPLRGVWHGVPSGSTRRFYRIQMVAQPFSDGSGLCLRIRSLSRMQRKHHRGSATLFRYQRCGQRRTQWQAGDLRGRDYVRAISPVLGNRCGCLHVRGLHDTHFGSLARGAYGLYCVGRNRSIFDRARIAIDTPSRPFREELWLVNGLVFRIGRTAGHRCLATRMA